jgi:hypothetical protein
MAIPICIRGWVGCYIPICKWGLLYLYAYGDLHMHTGISSMLICIWEMGSQQHHQSPYAYGDWHGPRIHMWASTSFKSLYAYGDHANHCMHMGIVQSLTHLHMVIACIWGFSHQIPICKILHMGIPVCIRGSIPKNRQNFHMGTPHLQNVMVSIW